MRKRRVFDDEKHIQFVTFSCYKRRRYLKTERAKRIVIGSLGARLAKHNGSCLGYVIMPDHVHVMVWFPQTGQLKDFLNHWKDLSSHNLKQLFREHYPSYWSRVNDEDPIWQPRYYSFNIWNRSKVEQKLDYMHLNPVRAGLCEHSIEYPYSSARWYHSRRFAYLPIKWPPGLEVDDQQHPAR